MEERSWSQQVIDRFFETRECPTQSECDDHARKISRSSTVQEVRVPGSLSYTVLCKNCPDEQSDLIVSFRQSESTLDQNVIKLAKSIHGTLVPEATFHGKMPGSNPPLLVYAMPCLQGIPCLEALVTKAELNPEEEARHICFIKHLARYFSRCWLSPQPVDPQVQADYQNQVCRRLIKLKDSSPSILPHATIHKLIHSLPILFKQTYPQVLTHNDLSQTIILVDEKTFEITEIVDWSLASVLPFGMELDTLLLATGYMDLSGWHNYTCRMKLLNSFWDEFWAQCQVSNDVRRQEIQTAAIQATEIGVVLRNAFQRSPDGSPSEELTTSNTSTYLLRFLLEYYPEGSLEQVLSDNTDQDDSLLRRWALQTGRALEILHTQQRTHLDIKPSNIVLDAKKNAILIDISGTGGYEWEWLSPEMQKIIQQNTAMIPASTSFDQRVATDCWAYGKLLSTMAKKIGASSLGKRLQSISDDLTKTDPKARISLSDALERT